MSGKTRASDPSKAEPGVAPGNRMSIGICLWEASPADLLPVSTWDEQVNTKKDLNLNSSLLE